MEQVKSVEDMGSEPTVNVLEQRIIDLIRRIENVETLHQQLIELNRQTAELIINMGHIKCDVQNLKTIVDNLDGQVTAIRMEPANAWQKFKWILISGVAGAVLALVLAKLGLSL